MKQSNIEFLNDKLMEVYLLSEKENDFEFNIITDIDLKFIHVFLLEKEFRFEGYKTSDYDIFLSYKKNDIEVKITYCRVGCYTFEISFFRFSEVTKERIVNVTNECNIDMDIFKENVKRLKRKEIPYIKGYNNHLSLLRVLIESVGYNQVKDCRGRMLRLKNNKKNKDDFEKIFNINVYEFKSNTYHPSLYIFIDQLANTFVIKRKEDIDENTLILEYGE